MFIYHIFYIHSFINGYLGWFCILTALNNAAMNIKLHIQFQLKSFCSLLSKESEIAELYEGSVVLIFLLIFILFSVVADRDKFNLDIEYLFHFVSPYFYNFWMTLMVHL